MLTEDARADVGSGGRVVFVVGLGHVGLPLALACVDAGHTMYGFDVDRTVLDRISAGRPHVEDAPAPVLRRALETGQLKLTPDPADCRGADVVIICVPTPLSETKTPDISAVEDAVVSVAQFLRVGCLVVLESTVYPGATEQHVLPILAQTGRVAGRDVYVAYSPERMDPANSIFGIRNTPKIVAGVTPSCAARAHAFYSTVVTEVVLASGVREAEMAKLLENTYRHVNIALVNEVAVACQDLGIDVWEVLRCAATKPFGFARFDPGPGVGGHCIPIDPSYLNAAAAMELGRPLRMIEVADTVNAGMPSYVVRRVSELLTSNGIRIGGASVLLVGVSYKPDVTDVRNSPALPIARELITLGATLAYLDPHVDSLVLDSAVIRRLEVGATEKFDVVLFLQHHTSVDPSSVSAMGRLAVDTRGVCGGEAVSVF